MDCVRAASLCVALATCAACDRPAPDVAQKEQAAVEDRVVVAPVAAPAPPNPNPAPAAEADVPTHADGRRPSGSADDDGAADCDESHPKRCFALARALPEGTPVRELVALLEPACSGGLPQACYALAAVLGKGAPGVPADRARARELTEQACREGSQVACDAMGH